MEVKFSSFFLIELVVPSGTDRTVHETAHHSHSGIHHRVGCVGLDSPFYSVLFLRV